MTDGSSLSVTNGLLLSGVAAKTGTTELVESRIEYELGTAPEIGSAGLLKRIFTALPSGEKALCTASLPAGHCGVWAVSDDVEASPPDELLDASGPPLQELDELLEGAVSAPLLEDELEDEDELETISKLDSVASRSRPVEPLASGSAKASSVAL